MTAAQVPQSITEFGVARGDITSPVGIYHRMWGAATHSRAAGVHRPLTATVAFFRAAGGADQQLLIALDHCVMGRREVDLMKGAVAAKTDIAADKTTLVCSHTHAAGLMLHDRSELPGGELIPPYLKEVGETVGELARAAIEGAQECSFVYGTGHCSLAAQRDFWDEQRGEYVCGFNPGGDCDDTVMVARATNAAGDVVATFVNYACHPTTLAWDNELISPDYPGAMREVVEAAIPAPCLFLQGASGDVGPRDGFVGDLEVADRNGRVLGHAAVSALLHLPPPRSEFAYRGAVVSGATIGVWEWEELDESAQQELRVWDVKRDSLLLDYRDELPTLDEVQDDLQRQTAAQAAAEAAGDEQASRDAHAMIERATRLQGRLRVLPPGSGFPLQYTCWRMGDAVWLIIQGEPYNLLQRELRDRFAGRPLIIGTIAENWGASYLPPSDRYGLPLYQESIAIVAPGSLERLIEHLSDEVQSLFASTP
ncbi:MAG: hypothetical protein QGG36_28335 [Pirellulaceae bacterium]|nr:hypothetical protein [Pirellulaceae bacterium]MDP7019739.1 hypothetical protein [Pirellulaceae bacterium]